LTIVPLELLVLNLVFGRILRVTVKLQQYSALASWGHISPSTNRLNFLHLKLGRLDHSSDPNHSDQELVACTVHLVDYQVAGSLVWLTVTDWEAHVRVQLIDRHTGYPHSSAVDHH